MSSEPSGVHFVDMASMRQMVLVQETDPRKDLHGWICYRGRDGVWMTLRMATEEDRRRVLLAQLAEARRPGPKLAVPSDKVVTL